MLCNLFWVWTKLTKFQRKLQKEKLVVFLWKGVLKICSEFTGEQPSRSVISIKLQISFVEITLPTACFPVNFLHIFWTPFHKNAFEVLLLQKERSTYSVLKKPMLIKKSRQNNFPFNTDTGTHVESKHFFF